MNLDLRRLAPAGGEDAINGCDEDMVGRSGRVGVTLLGQSRKSHRQGGNPSCLLTLGYSNMHRLDLLACFTAWMSDSEVTTKSFPQHPSVRIAQARDAKAIPVPGVTISYEHRFR